MNTSDLLEQLLRASQGSARQQNSGAGQSGLGGLLGGLLGAGSAGSGSGGAGGLGGLLGGLLGGGMSGRLGNGAPKGGSGGTHYAMLASLGMMAFQAYQAWQRQQAVEPQQASLAHETPRTVDLLAGPEVEEHSHAILRALIAAAKADGTIDEREQALISKEIDRHADDPELQAWLKAEVSKPLDATEVAQAAIAEPGMAAEMYLASVLLVDDQQDAERNYLDELAAALNIDPGLQVHLEQQAKGAA